MKKETKVLIAGSIGFIAILGLLGIRKLLERKDTQNQETYADYYLDFDDRYNACENDGIEFLGMR